MKKIIGILIILTFIIGSTLLNAAGPDIAIERFYVYEKKVGDCNFVKVNLANVGNHILRKDFRVFIYVFKGNNTAPYDSKIRTIRNNIRPNGKITFFQRGLKFPRGNVRVTISLESSTLRTAGDNNDRNDHAEESFNINQLCVSLPDLTIGKMFIKNKKLVVYIKSLNRAKSNKDIFVTQAFNHWPNPRQKLRVKLDGRKFVVAVYFDIPREAWNTPLRYAVTVDDRNQIREIDERNNSKVKIMTCNVR